MTARGAVGRPKEQGRSAVRIKEDENDGGWGVIHADGGTAGGWL